MGPVPIAVPMTIQRVEVITGLERRRQFSDEKKLRLVEEAFQPGVKATEVARRLGVESACCTAGAASSSVSSSGCPPSCRSRSPPTLRHRRRWRSRRRRQRPHQPVSSRSSSRRRACASPARSIRPWSAR
ncbi:transposase [Azospirillum sp. INR13]|nr:transposase [Azospirillum sp. INR13]